MTIAQGRSGVVACFKIIVTIQRKEGEDVAKANHHLSLSGGTRTNFADR